MKVFKEAEVLRTLMVAGILALVLVGVAAIMEAEAYAPKVITTFFLLIFVAKELLSHNEPPKQY